MRAPLEKSASIIFLLESRRTNGRRFGVTIQKESLRSSIIFSMQTVIDKTRVISHLSREECFKRYETAKDFYRRLRMTMATSSTPFQSWQYVCRP
jgi:hypothetical protein